VLREFRKITQAAGLGTGWVPREMRHTFVSLLSSSGTALEDIADLVGHKGTVTPETVYRKVIVTCPSELYPNGLICAGDIKIGP
jgi:integrase